MRSVMHKSYTLLLLLSIALFLSSFSLSPPLVKHHQEHPPEVSQQQQRFQKQRKRLQKRLRNARNEHQKQRLKKRLKRLEKQNNDVKSTPVFGVLGFIAGIVALLVFISSLGVGAAAALSGTGFLLANIMFWGGIALALIGLGLSILHLVLRQQDPDRYSRPGFAIAGLILNGLLVGFLFLALLGGSITP